MIDETNWNRQQQQMGQSKWPMITIICRRGYCLSRCYGCYIYAGNKQIRFSHPNGTLSFVYFIYPEKKCYFLGGYLFTLKIVNFIFENGNWTKREREKFIFPVKKENHPKTTEFGIDLLLILNHEKKRHEKNDGEFSFFVLETISVSSTNITCIFFYLAKMDPFTHIDQTFVHTQGKRILSKW